MRPGRYAAVVAIALVMAPASARAATVSTASYLGSGSVDLVVYRASPGERNAITARATAAGWTFTDTGAPVVAAPPCIAVDAHTATCAPPAGAILSRADIDAGDRDDRVNWSRSPDFSPQVVAKGGDGNDVLGGTADGHRIVGGPGDDVLLAGRFINGGTLDGGPGDDVLIGSRKEDNMDGGGGRDALYGRGSADVMTDGDRDDNAGPDLLDGGPGGCCITGGGDEVSYRGRAAPVRVDLADPAPDGAAGESDVLVDVESVDGGTGDDVLLGNRRGNWLRGHRGRDRLAGRGGPDTLEPGLDDGRISCGGGNDDVINPGVDNRLTASCELVLARYPVDALPARGKRGNLRYAVRCPEASPDAPALFRRCHGSLHIREAGGMHRLLGVGSFPSGRWERLVFTVRLTPLGRRLAIRRSVLATLRLAIRYYDEESVVGTVRWTIPLRV